MRWAPPLHVATAQHPPRTYDTTVPYHVYTLAAGRWNPDPEGRSQGETAMLQALSDSAGLRLERLRCGG
jgi:hypothetical protein